MDKLKENRKMVSRARRIVVKIGSGTLTRDDGLNLSLIKKLAANISELKAQNRKIVIVSSGAIAAGLKKVGLSERPSTIQEKQACAAVGQASLMMAYEKAFSRHGHQVAQILLTTNDLSNRRRYLNARNTLTTLFEWDIIPIINENDTVAVEEIKVGDNDTLSGMITGLVEADLLINLTDIDGLYDRDPRDDADAEFISEVKSVGRKIEAMAGAIPGSLGTGGMFTKVRAAKQVAKRGVPTVIANGKTKNILKRILAGEELGTLFLPTAETLPQRKFWIAYTSKIQGQVIVDDGARRALLKQGKSLLPSGITAVKDQFNLGDAIEIADAKGLVIAVGLTNYSSKEITRILGCQTCDIESLLGYKHADEVIHRDNLVVGEDLRL
jgi:glutamate 5-kinase